MAVIQPAKIIVCDWCGKRISTERVQLDRGTRFVHMSVNCNVDSGQFYEHDYSHDICAECWQAVKDLMLSKNPRPVRSNFGKKV